MYVKQTLITYVDHNIWPVYVYHTIRDVQLKLHKNERCCFQIAQRQLANVPLICVLHNTQSS